MDESIQKHLVDGLSPPTERWALWDAAEGSWCAQCLMEAHTTRESVARIHNPAYWAAKLNFIMRVQ